MALGWTVLLGVKSFMTLFLGGLFVLGKPRAAIAELPYKTLTSGHIHMVKMWGVWMSFFQAPLEVSFAYFVQGSARNVFGLIEGWFEVALLVEVMWDRRTANAAHYSKPMEITYFLTVVAFFGVLILAPDPVPAEDEEMNRNALLCGTGVCVLSFLVQILGLWRGVDYRDRTEEEKATLTAEAH
jgi:uncharacterized membrane protein